MFGRKKAEEKRSVQKAENSQGKTVRIWKSISCVLATGLLCMLFTGLGKVYSVKQGREMVEYPEIFSKLQEETACFLCENDTKSMSNYYRQLNTIGLISLNDGYMIDFKLGQSDSEDPDKNSAAAADENMTGLYGSGTVFDVVNTGTVNICSERIPSGREVSMQVTWKDDLMLDPVLIEERLCQNCLKKVKDSLTIKKYCFEKKAPLPFCLVDFQTMEIYSVQDWTTRYHIRNYLVDVLHFEDGLKIKVTSCAAMASREESYCAKPPHTL